MGNKVIYDLKFQLDSWNLKLNRNQLMNYFLTAFDHPFINNKEKLFEVLIIL